MPVAPPGHDDGRMLVLALNSGSSSLKFALVDSADGSRKLAGLAERLGSAEASLKWEGAVNGSMKIPGAGHKEALAAVVEALDASGLKHAAVGHRVVHGGERFNHTLLVDDGNLTELRSVSHLAPLHNPANLLGIDAARALWPSLPQAAVFDTMFHLSMPARAYRYAVPTSWYTEHGVRRYGFHGISHQYVSRTAAGMLGKPLAQTALVTAHLGNGCSATAVLGGKSMDTTMGLTPLEGLVMGTRSGDVDPGLHDYLCARLGIDVKELTRRLNRECGLTGVSGVSNDMRAVCQAADGGNADAKLAVSLFCYRLAKAIAGLTVALGRLDAVVFTGGIGENAKPIRAETVGLLGVLGCTLDAVANDRHGRDTKGRIGDKVLVVPTDEERLIAEETARAAKR